MTKFLGPIFYQTLFFKVVSPLLEKKIYFTVLGSDSARLPRDQKISQCTFAEYSNETVHFHNETLHLRGVCSMNLHKFAEHTK